MAKNKQQFNKRWYNRYRSALKYFGVDVPEIAKPNKRHLAKVKNQWQGIRKEMKSKGWIDLPTVYQASNMVDDKPTVESNYSDYLDNYLQKTIMEIESKDYHEVQKYKSGVGAVGQLEEQKRNLIDIIASARAKIGDDRLLATAIAKSTFVERALQTIEYYTRATTGTDAVTFMDREVTPLLEQAIDDVIREL